MRPTVLVTSASRHAATHEIGEAIAAALLERGIAAEALPMEQVTGLAEYDAVHSGAPATRSRRARRQTFRFCGDSQTRSTIAPSAGGSRWAPSISPSGQSCARSMRPRATVATGMRSTGLPGRSSTSFSVRTQCSPELSSSPKDPCGGRRMSYRWRRRRLDMSPIDPGPPVGSR
jgi:hypothetical protein